MTTTTPPHAGGTTAYRGASSGWLMEEALREVTLKGCAE